MGSILRDWDVEDPGDLFLAWTTSSKRNWMRLEPVEEGEERALSYRESRKVLSLSRSSRTEKWGDEAIEGERTVMRMKRTEFIKTSDSGVSSCWRI